MGHCGRKETRTKSALLACPCSHVRHVSPHVNPPHRSGSESGQRWLHSQAPPKQTQLTESGQQGRPEGRILGGSDAAAGEFPAHVSLHVGVSVLQQFICSGTLFSPTWVVTAAHCCQGFNQFTVRAGDLNRKSVDEGEQEVKSTRVISHDGYNIGTWGIDLAYDICLVELASPMVESEVVGFADLPATPKEDPEDGTLLSLAGWGMTHNLDVVKPDWLQRTDLPAISDVACKASYSDSHYWEWLKEDMICAGDLVTPSMGPCNGDFGGGLMDGQQIVGITSWEARGCGHPKHPGVFLQVSYFLDWIASHMT